MNPTLNIALMTLAFLLLAGLVIVKPNKVTVLLLAAFLLATAYAWTVFLGV